MGKSYFVPRNVKGESRILYIFTMKSFIYTLIFGLIGFFVGYIVGLLADISLIIKIIIIGIFGVIGYIIGAVKIPDSPAMGPLRKAGGEYLSDILFRIITFGSKKKIYVYNINRDVKNQKKEKEKVNLKLK